jgi:hypothetical protein
MKRPNRANSIGPAEKRSSGCMFLAFLFFDRVNWVLLCDAMPYPALYPLGFS